MEKIINISQRHVILDLKADDRFSAYEEMVSHLVHMKYLSNMDKVTITNRLEERESQSTFAVGKNIAIPHINGLDIPTSLFLYARSVEGIEFGSCDSGLVHHLFLALIPSEQKCGWLKTLSRLSRTLKDSSIRDTLMYITDAEETSKLLTTHFSA